jgi:hypothetical protein
VWVGATTCAVIAFYFALKASDPRWPLAVATLAACIAAVSAFTARPNHGRTPAAKQRSGFLMLGIGASVFAVFFGLVLVGEWPNGAGQEALGAKRFPEAAAALAQASSRYDASQRIARFGRVTVTRSGILLSAEPGVLAGLAVALADQGDAEGARVAIQRAVEGAPSWGYSDSDVEYLQQLAADLQ